MFSTIISWGLTLCLVGAAIYVYKPELLNGAKPQVQETKAPAPKTIPPPSSKKQKSKRSAVPKLAEDAKAGSVSDGQAAKKRKITPAANEKPGATSTQTQKQDQTSKDEGDGLSDKDFAKQLAQAQSGNKLQVPQKQQQQQPSKKERRASKLIPVSSPDPSGISTEASSTTGRDADDDLTPAESPQAKPVDTHISKAGDVSDMLEPQAAKPTTLRLTDIPTDTKPKKAANKSFEQVLSKKKRNEKQRKEEARLAREESDRLHEAKKQEQLRRARLAAGTSNQTKANNFAAKANAWQSGASNVVKTAPATEAEPFLDTFDPTSSTLSESHGAVHTRSAEGHSANDLKAKTGENAAAALTASASREGPSAAKIREYASEMSEEDQIQTLREQQQEDEWESVTTKKSKRKGKQDNDSTSGASSPVRAAPVVVKSQANSSKVNGATKKSETVNRFESFQDKSTTKVGLEDAEWEA